MTPKANQEAKREVLDVCQEMQRVALVIGSSGNASFRIPDTGDRNPSTEHPLHTAIYKARPDVNAIVHTHGIYASALAVLQEPLPPIIDEFVIKLGGQIEVAKYGLPGSEELATNVVEALGPRNGVLLANHGGVCVGPSMDVALHNALLLERVAQIYLLASAVDKKKINLLPAESIEMQHQMFEMMKRVKKR